MRPTARDYEEAFALECASSYPAVDAFVGTEDVDRSWLESAARVLACPIKINRPCWQHGRVLYAAAVRALRALSATQTQPDPVTLLDIGTAKGFSALCLARALGDVGLPGRVVTVDVVNPDERVRRNTVAELDGLKTVEEVLSPYLTAGIAHVDARWLTGVTWLSVTVGRLPVVFVDGKHDGAVVAEEARLIEARQLAGDVMVLDDVHLQPLRAVAEQLKCYDVTWIEALPHRAYAVAVRR
jgi:predicted O-methyltransferase YrrM